MMNHLPCRSGGVFVKYDHRLSLVQLTEARESLGNHLVRHLLRFNGLRYAEVETSRLAAWTYTFTAIPSDSHVKVKFWLHITITPNNIDLSYSHYIQHVNFESLEIVDTVKTRISYNSVT
jgi:hypothetical protein